MLAINNTGHQPCHTRRSRSEVNWRHPRLLLDACAISAALGLATCARDNSVSFAQKGLFTTQSINSINGCGIDAGRN
jgi:hypothetical protein